MKIIDDSNVIYIIKETLNKVDPRLVNHGQRVAYIVQKILSRKEHVSNSFMAKATIMALLHDIGAYKIEDINRMLQFEADGNWNHSIYGYLFLRNLSPLGEDADAILYHHLPYKNYSLFQNKTEIPPLAGLLFLADRIDIAVNYCSIDSILPFMQKQNHALFDPQWFQLFLDAQEECDILWALKNGSYQEDFDRCVSGLMFTEEEKRRYLELVAYSIDFRSEFMVLHTITTVHVSMTIGKLLNLPPEEINKIYYGALLHDVGKVATPIEILEKPGKLTTEEMDIMKLHVVVTEEILSGYVEKEIMDIAVCHHEKLDGSGYPHGLTGEQITINQRIVAIADIVSALIRKRSYKQAYDETITKQILTDMADNHKLCPEITQLVVDNLNLITTTADRQGQQLLEIYQSLMKIYNHVKDLSEDEITPQNLSIPRIKNVADSIYGGLDYEKTRQRSY